MAIRRFLLLALAAFPVIAAIFYVTRSSPPPAAVKAAVPPSVSVVTPSEESLSNKLNLTAEFRPYQEVDVHAKVAGYLKSITVDVGDRVTQGQLLATLEVPEAADEVTRATAARKRSEAELERQRGELRRAELAHELAHLSYNRLAGVLKSRPNLVAQSEIDEALSRDRIAEAQIGAIKSSIAAAEQQVQESSANFQKATTLQAYTRITAPFSGVVTRRYADPGAMIQAGTASQTQAMPVVRISQTERLRLVFPVPESIVPRIRQGSEISITVQSLDRTITGRVSRFTRNVTAATRTMDTEVDVPNPGLQLVPGMYATASLTLDKRDHALTVPLQVLSKSGDQQQVWVVTPDHTLQPRIVETGLQTPNSIEITAGIRPDDQLVVGARADFKPGMTVTPRALEIARGN